MKVGDKVPVTLAGHVVAQAEVRELGDGKAVLILPATQVTMAVRTELDAPPVEPRETETVITGVDRQESATVNDETEATQTVSTTGAPEAVGAPETVQPDPAENVTSPDAGTEAAVAEAPVVETTTVEAPVESSEQA